jgi:hypothetical protein
MDMPAKATKAADKNEFKTVAQLIEEGRDLLPLETLKWSKGDGKRRVAFLCYSSGTSGLPVSHIGVLWSFYTLTDVE